MRQLLTELMDVEGVNSFLAEKITGIGIRYDFGEGPELLGLRLRDIPLSQGRLYELSRDGRGLLLDTTGELSLTGWTDRIHHIHLASGELSAPAILLRPDGHVAWIGTSQEDLPPSPAHMVRGRIICGAGPPINQGLWHHGNYHQDDCPWIGLRP